MPNCAYCGRPNADNAVVCSGCGTPFPADTPEAAAAEPVIDDALRAAAQRQMLSGAITCVAGIVITIGSYAFAAPGGSYLVAWGAIVFGAIRFFRGLSGFNAKPDNEDLAYRDLAVATELETQGRVEEALARYVGIAHSYPDTAAAQDARKSWESLRAKMSGQSGANSPNVKS